MVAVVPVRAGELPAGGAEAVAEASGRAVLVGEGSAVAAGALQGIATELRVWDTPGYAPGRWAAALAPLLVEEALVILPASPDGRDLGPRIAVVLGWPLLAGAVEVRSGRVSTMGFGGAVMADHPLQDHVVVTLQPGVRGVERTAGALPPIEELSLPTPEDGTAGVGGGEPVPDAVVVEVLPPDLATMDLAESPRILAGGNGLDSSQRFEQLGRVAATVGASVGTTRVITDKGWLPHSRQIGTTGVVVDPRLYLAFGISGAVQHTAGLGRPDHVIAVNTEAHCPMMAMADLAVVADANATLEEIERLLGPGEGTGS